MSDPLGAVNGHDGATDTKPFNGQLVTPALSPISEHGDRGLQPFPGYEADDEWIRSPIDAAETSQASGLGINGKPESVRRKSSNVSGTSKLSPQQIHELVSSPESLPVRAIPSIESVDERAGALHANPRRLSRAAVSENESDDDTSEAPLVNRPKAKDETLRNASVSTELPRPTKGLRSVSTPMMRRSSSNTSKHPKEKPALSQIQTDTNQNGVPKSNARVDIPASPLPHLLPLPPLSLPTYLQLELSSDRPSALYLHRPSSADFPYESSKVKFERLYNFLLVPGYLEQVLWFGAVTCLDAWLYTFTILPLRFLKAIAILLQWWGRNAFKEIFDLAAFVYGGIGRLRKRRQNPVVESRRPSLADLDISRSSSAYFDDRTQSSNGNTPAIAPPRKSAKVPKSFNHRRTRSTPSALLPNHKADILQGCLIVISCYILMWFDASRMYHNIRGQSAIKLYVIYNVLEVFDRLFAALGQDILECLFSKETLERGEDGRSKVIRPFWMFILALVYNVVHSTALFYQCITLNVAVNSYSNALLTLLMSNQFVEIKGTVFKKFEKENLFQLTCADVVERFQLWLMLLIIALRNIVEIGGLSISISSAFGGLTSASNAANGTSKGVPLMGGIVIPQAFTLMPKWTGEVLGPFLIVLGSEMLVDWCKHAYITKFNNVKPRIYGRFFDVLAKDYYSHAFADQNLTKRLGLPVIPLSCLFIRACVQTYHMLLAIHLPPPIPSTATSISLEADAASTSPATLAAIRHIDQVFRRALGRSSFGAGHTPSSPFNWWSVDDAIALGTMVTCFLALYLVLLALKLVLGICLLSIARNRYRGMKEREHQKTNTDGRRMGGWGVVEVGDERRRWIYEDDPNALKQLQEKEDRGRRKSNPNDKLDTIDRYSMVAKRIW